MTTFMHGTVNRILTIGRTMQLQWKTDINPAILPFSFLGFSQQLSLCVVYFRRVVPSGPDHKAYSLGLESMEWPPRNHRIQLESTTEITNQLEWALERPSGSAILTGPVLEEEGVRTMLAFRRKYTLTVMGVEVEDDVMRVGMVTVDEFIALLLVVTHQSY